jgi:hypothetical protein
MKKSNIEQNILHESIYSFLEYTWKDIHHSRLQNWTGITIVTTFHIGILKLTEYFLDNKAFNETLKITLFTFGSLFCLIGFLITRVHQKQLYKKLGWIKAAEEKLGLNLFKNESPIEKKNEDKLLRKSFKFLKRNLFTAGSLMSYFYLLLMIFDILCMFLFPSKLYNEY